MRTHAHTYKLALALSISPTHIQAHRHTYLTALNAYKISKSSKSRKIRVSCTFAAFMSPSTSLMDESNAFYASFGCLQMYLFMSTCCSALLCSAAVGWQWGWGWEKEIGWLGTPAGAGGDSFIDHMRTHASAVKGIEPSQAERRAGKPSSSKFGNVYEPCCCR